MFKLRKEKDPKGLMFIGNATAYLSRPEGSHPVADVRLFESSFLFLCFTINMRPFGSGESLIKKLVTKEVHSKFRTAFLYSSCIKRLFIPSAGEPVPLWRKVAASCSREKLERGGFYRSENLKGTLTKEWR